MPEMPQQGAPAEAAPENDLASQLESLGQNLTGLVEAVGASGAPDGVKQAAGELMAAFEGFAAAVQGGGAGEVNEGTTTPEQGASGAVPMSPGGY